MYPRTLSFRARIAAWRRCAATWPTQNCAHSAKAPPSRAGNSAERDSEEIGGWMKSVLSFCALTVAVFVTIPAQSEQSSPGLTPKGTLRAAYIATNPVQAYLDPETKE